MKTIKRKNLRKKILSDMRNFISICGRKRTDSQIYHYVFRIVKQNKKFYRKNIVLAKKIVRSEKSRYRLIALEGVMYLKTNGVWYEIVG
jgi:hypothetical protein